MIPERGEGESWKQREGNREKMEQNKWQLKVQETKKGGGGSGSGGGGGDGGM